jgi:carbon storage regulator
VLVLARKVSERLLIGDGVVVTVVAVRGGTVRIGITAPPELRVHRAEVRTRPAERGEPQA